MPGADHLPASVSDVVSECSYWAAKNLPVVELIGTNFVEAFVKRGEFRVVPIFSKRIVLKVEAFLFHSNLAIRAWK